MGKLHTKRHTAPKSWHILRKAGVFITTIRPGAHNKALALPLSVILKDVVNVANSTREVKRALQLKEVLVDGRRVKDHKKGCLWRGASGSGATEIFAAKSGARSPDP